MRKLMKFLSVLIVFVLLNNIFIHAVTLQKEYTDHRTSMVVKQGKNSNLINKTIKVDVGTSYNLEYVLGDTRNAKATFKSSNTDLATVGASNGNVTFLAAGDVNIKITPYQSSNTYKIRFRITDHNAKGNAWVRVNIAKQEAYLYVSGKRVRTAQVVTGTKGKHDTPKGTFYIEAHQRNTHLDGRPLGYNYYLPVRYWMPLGGTGGVGLHDARWRNNANFGLPYYQQVGSHGCINMRDADVAYFFKYLRVGSKVIIE